MGYKAIAESIRSQIKCGEFDLNMRIPSERVLAEQFQVQRLTVRRALELLENEGLILRRGNQGTVVVSAPSERPHTAVLLGNARSDAGQAILSGFESRIHPESKRRVAAIDRILPDKHGALSLPTLDWLTQERIGAYALMPEWTQDNSGLKRHQNALSIVLLDRRVLGFESDFVGFDNKEGGRIAARHLIGLGHRKIAFAGVAFQETVIDRLAGVQEVLEAAGLPLLWPWMLLRFGLEHVPLSVLQAMLELPDRPTAVVCANDINAMKLATALQRLGLCIPEDMALVGFGGESTETCDALGLTTARLPYFDMGHAACDRILTRQTLDSKEEFTQTILPVSLVVRSSCGSLAISTHSVSTTASISTLFRQR